MPTLKTTKQNREEFYLQIWYYFMDNNRCTKWAEGYQMDSRRMVTTEAAPVPEMWKEKTTKARSD